MYDELGGDSVFDEKMCKLFFFHLSQVIAIVD